MKKSNEILRMAQMGVLTAIAIVLVALVRIPLIPVAQFLVYDMADVTLDAVNIHVVGIATEKSPKPDLKDLFNEDFLND